MTYRLLVMPSQDVLSQGMPKPNRITRPLRMAEYLVVSRTDMESGIVDITAEYPLSSRVFFGLIFKLGLVDFLIPVGNSPLIGFFYIPSIYKVAKLAHNDQLPQEVLTFSILTVR